MNDIARTRLGVVGFALVFLLWALAGCEYQKEQETDRLTNQWLEIHNAELPNGNVERVLEIHAEDVFVTGPRGDQRGVEELRAFFSGWKERLSSVTHNEVSRVVQGNRVALRVSWVGESKDGKPIRFPIAFFLEFDDNGKVKTNHVYFDTGAIAKQLE